MASPQLMSGLGTALAMFLSTLGASWASVPAGGFALHFKGSCFTAYSPIIIAGVLALYGTIVSVVMVMRSSSANDAVFSTADGYRHFSAGLLVGFTCLVSGSGLSGFVGETLQTMRNENRVSFHDTHTMDEDESNQNQREPLLRNRLTINTTPKMNDVRFLMILVFLEAIGLYGLLVAIYMVV